MRKQFKDTVLRLAGQDEKVVVVLGDISHFLFNPFQEQYPDRFYNMGICENTIISVAAGLSSQGFHPFAHTITPFITERSLEQIKLDMCYNHFGGNVVSTGASFDYAWDGATHHAYTDLAILRLIPGMNVMQPGNRKEIDILLSTQYNTGRSNYFRLSDHPHTLDLPCEFGKGVVVKDSHADVTIMTAGPIVENVVKAVQDLPVNLVYFHTIKPIDREVISKFKDTKILVVHDAHGLYEAIADVPHLKMERYGLPDDFLIWYGTVHDIRAKVGLDPNSIREKVQNELRK